MTLSKLSEKCKKCPYVETCKHKQMEMVGLLEKPTMSENMNPLAQDLAIKHDYRDIKIDKNTTVTIDLEELKQNIAKEICRNAGLGLFYGG